MKIKRTEKELVMEKTRNLLTQTADLKWMAKDKAEFEYLKAAAFTANTKKVTIAMAEKCGNDKWVVVQARSRKWALFTGDSISLIPTYIIPIMQHPPVDE